MFFECQYLVGVGFTIPKNNASILIYLVPLLGPLAACHDIVDPQPFYTSCVFDVCVTNLNVDQLCGSIKNYVQRCRALQGNPGEWWKFVRQCGNSCYLSMETLKFI